MNQNAPGIIRIGTSNITLPGNKLSFPEEFRSLSRLGYYSTLFNSLEVNSSFYKIPLGRTFARWGAEVTEGFQFSVKLWKGITHNKELVFSESDVKKFMEAVANLGDKAGCLLIQFPKSIKADCAGKLAELLESVRSQEQSISWRIAVEFRDTGWYKPDVFSLLNQYQASVVLHDMPGSANVGHNPSMPFVFARFHGEKGDYRGSYSETHLQKFADSLRQYHSSGKDVFVYFNNTIGEAYENARTLQRLVKDV